MTTFTNRRVTPLKQTTLSDTLQHWTSFLKIFRRNIARFVGSADHLAAASRRPRWSCQMARVARPLELPDGRSCQSPKMASGKKYSVAVKLPNSFLAISTISLLTDTLHKMGWRRWAVTQRKHSVYTLSQHSLST